MRTLVPHQHEWVAVHHLDDAGNHYCPTGFVRCVAGQRFDPPFYCGEWEKHDEHPEIPLCERWEE